MQKAPLQLFASAESYISRRASRIGRCNVPRSLARSAVMSNPFVSSHVVLMMINHLSLGRACTRVATLSARTAYWGRHFHQTARSHKGKKRYCPCFSQQQSHAVHSSEKNAADGKCTPGICRYIGKNQIACDGYAIFWTKTCCAIPIAKTLMICSNSVNFEEFGQLGYFAISVNFFAFPSRIFG